MISIEFRLSPLTVVRDSKWQKQWSDWAVYRSYRLHRGQFLVTMRNPKEAPLHQLDNIMEDWPALEETTLVHSP